MSYTINGKEVSQEEFLVDAKDDWLVAAPMTAMTYRAHDPLVSESTGVMPHQVPEARAELAKEHERGRLTGVRIADNGSAEFSARGEQGRIGWMRYKGNKVDGDGGYGDTYTPY